MTWGLEPARSAGRRGRPGPPGGDLGQPVSPGEAGELLVRGPDVSTGYWAGPGVSTARRGTAGTGRRPDAAKTRRRLLVRVAPEGADHPRRRQNLAVESRGMVAHPASGPRRRSACRMPFSASGAGSWTAAGAARSAVDEDLADLARGSPTTRSGVVEVVDEIPTDALARSTPALRR